MLVQNWVDEVLNYLDPYQTYNSQIHFSKTGLMIDETNFPLKGKVFLFSLGKSASFELDALVKLFKENNISFEKAVSFTKKGFSVPEASFLQLEGDHPLVSKENIELTEKFIEHLGEVSSEDTLIFLLSGGASALLEKPKEGIGLKEIYEKQLDLLNSGESIHFVNEKRKEQSLVKGGQLKNFISSTNIIQFISSDVPGQDVLTVGSAPLLNGINDPPSFVIQSGERLLAKFKGEGRIIGPVYDIELSQLLKEIQLPKKGQVCISGGEAPIFLPERYGRGGRNTHFVLAMAYELYKDPKNHDIWLMSLATDGDDGNTKVAGAYINFDTFQKLDPTAYLMEFNSYEYFKKVNTLIKTPPTKSNLMDIRFIGRP